MQLIKDEKEKNSHKHNRSCNYHLILTTWIIQTQISDIQIQISEIQNQNDQLESQNNSLQNQTINLQTRNSQLQTQITELKSPSQRFTTMNLTIQNKAQTDKPQ